MLLYFPPTMIGIIRKVESLLIAALGEKAGCLTEWP